MKTQLQKRLEELKSEFESGQKMLSDLEVKQAELQKNMLRISGAIQVLEEEIAKCDEDPSAEVVDIKSSEGTG
jgi:predicted nuclease with TOPRIM domain